MKNIFNSLFLLISSITFAQSSASGLDVKAYIGIQNNFFVDYDRKMKKENGYIIPVDNNDGRHSLFQKNSIGTVHGVYISYRFNKNNGIGIDYSKTENTGLYDEYINYTNGNVLIDQMKLKHINNTFSIIYSRYNILKNFNAGIGLGVIFTDQQEIMIGKFGPITTIQNFRWSMINVPIIVNYYFYNKNNIKVGIEARTDWTPTYSGEFENIMLYPTLGVSF